jgi:hypothetical protein
MSTRKKEDGTSTLLRQYKALKARYSKAILLFRVGDSYEAFGDDASTLHDVQSARGGQFHRRLHLTDRQCSYGWSVI